MYQFCKQSYFRLKIALFIIAGISSCLSSCKKFLEIDGPTDELITRNVFVDDKTATSAVLGIYIDMFKGSMMDHYFSRYMGLYADELLVSGSDATTIEFGDSHLQVANSTNGLFWSSPFSYIYQANLCLSGIAASGTLSENVRTQLIGELKFIRAFSFFYLVNVFGDVPLVRGTDYEMNRLVARAPQAQVLQQVITDIQEARSLLTASYVSTDKVRPNKWTATALLSRVYLYTGDWARADSMASEIILSGVYSPLPAPDKVFLKNNKEAIWQVGFNDRSVTNEAFNFVPRTVAIPNYPLRDELVNTFEPNDQRKTNWVGSITVAGTTYYYPYKYKVITSGVPTEQMTIFRLAEQYLIRAEARAHLGNIDEGVADVDVVRSRAGLPLLSVIKPNMTKSELLQAIEQERRVELFAEQGHRWFDLKRTGRVEAVLAPLKPATWQSRAILFPIPEKEMLSNPALEQNEGY